jgi:hypothetical protein
MSRNVDFWEALLDTALLVVDSLKITRKTFLFRSSTDISSALLCVVSDRRSRKGSSYHSKILTAVRTTRLPVQSKSRISLLREKRIL